MENNKEEIQAGLKNPPIKKINFGKIKKVIDIPSLIHIQRDSYVDFLQKSVDPEKESR